MRKMPVLGLAGMFANSIKGRYKGRPDVLVDHISEQVLYTGLALVLYALLNQDDDKKKVIFTGTKPVSYGKREFGYRSIPESSIAWKWQDDWYYLPINGIEPIGSTMPVVVDALNNLKAVAEQGKDIGKAREDLFSALRMATTDKTFMMNISDALDIVYGRKSFATKSTDILANMAAGLVMPNLVKSVIALSDDKIRQRHNQDSGWIGELAGLPLDIIKKAIPVSKLKPPAKVDIVGEEVKKPMGSMGIYSKLLGLPSDVYKVSEMSEFDKWLKNYNKLNPNEEWYPTQPKSIMKNGKTMPVSDEKWKAFLETRGKIIAKFIKNMRWANIRANKDGLKVIQKLLSKATEMSKIQNNLGKYDIEER